MTDAILFDLQALAAPEESDPAPILDELRALGHATDRRALLAACQCVLYVETPREGYGDAEGVVRAVLRHLGRKPKRTEVMALAPLFVDLFRHTLTDDAARAIPVLAESYRIAVLSPLPAALLGETLAAIRSEVEAVVTPEEATTHVPGPEAVRTALTALDVSPADAAFVGVHCDDLATVRSSGVTPIHLRRPGSGPCANAAVTVRLLGELGKALATHRTDHPIPVPVRGP